VTIGEFLRDGQAKLTAADTSSPRLDCLILLEDLIGRDRSWILANLDSPLSASQLSRLARQLDRRSGHEPLAYIRGFSEFYGRRFKVNKRVLEPRPESETMIDLLKGLSLPAKPKIADVGTGSGCLGVTAALEIPGSQVSLYDIDSSALAVARHNAHMHELQLPAHKRDLLNRPAGDYEVILANLPYLPDDWQIDRSITGEPRIAFFGGGDGLDLYRRLFDQLSKLKSPLYVLSEAFPGQHKTLAKIAKSAGYETVAGQDFTQVFEFSRPA
jgi:release factor glutamine methyltransferase